ncbi:hypothetical protein Cma02nite_21410 [Cellulomonas marina]|uniref:TrwC relaxase n=2 Tax=Cellulomonas marina TaxID=988821 RepID=A0A1I0XAR3_9CELL|nr:hypothetical protein Cma02nite_21410 [Cellulomonas marina]SFA97767.1 TrwC relaxase [Cellulomonas marina]
MIAAAFDHWDIRAIDPNVYKHAVVADKVQGPDGIWRSVDRKTVHAATIIVSELCDSVLADEVARRLPVRCSHRDRGPRRNPVFEIDDIDDAVLAHFSVCSEQIRCAEQDWAAKFVADHGREPTRVETTKARQYLARTIRPPKTVRPLAELLTEWANHARALTGAARTSRPGPTRAVRARAALHDIGPDVRAMMKDQLLAEVSAKRSVWTTWNPATEALRASKPLRMA